MTMDVDDFEYPSVRISQRPARAHTLLDERTTLPSSVKCNEIQTPLASTSSVSAAETIIRHNHAAQLGTLKDTPAPPNPPAVSFIYTP